MVERICFIRVLDDIPTYKELYERVRRNSRRRAVLKVDRTKTAAEAMPKFQHAVNSFRAGADVLAITMMSVGIVVRGQDGKRATNRNVDIIWFPDVPTTTFFANEDIVAYAGDWPEILCKAPGPRSV